MSSRSRDQSKKKKTQKKGKRWIRVGIRWCWAPMNPGRSVLCSERTNAHSMRLSPTLTPASLTLFANSSLASLCQRSYRQAILYMQCSLSLFMCIFFFCSFAYIVALFVLIAVGFWVLGRERVTLLGFRVFLVL